MFEDNSSNSNQHEVPGDPEVSGDPEVPGGSEVPGDPEVSGDSGVSCGHEVPGDSGVPGDHKVPGAPGLPSDSGGSDGSDGLSGLDQLVGSGAGLAEASDRVLFDQLAACVRLEAQLMARKARLIAALTVRDTVEAPDGYPFAGVNHELVAVALSMNPARAKGEVMAAHLLVEQCPKTLVALDQGELSAPVARALLAEFEVVKPGLITKIEDRVLPTAKGRTPAAVRSSVRRAAISLDKYHEAKEVERCVKERFVSLVPEPFGMATLSAYLPAQEAVSLYNVLSETARCAKSRDKLQRRRLQATVASYRPPGAGAGASSGEGVAGTGSGAGSVEGGEGSVSGLVDQVPPLLSMGAYRADALIELAKRAASELAAQTSSGTGMASCVQGGSSPVLSDPGVPASTTPAPATPAPVVSASETSDPLLSDSVLSDPGVPASATPAPATPDPVVSASEISAPVVPVPVRFQAHVVLDVATALGLADNPAHLVQYGSIPGQVARELAVDSCWEAWVTNAAGQLQAVGSRLYRPSAGLRRFVMARDQVCQFPGCQVRAVDTDLDHSVPFGQGGVTSAANLHCLCRRHHRLKTHFGWDTIRDPGLEEGSDSSRDPESEPDPSSSKVGGLDDVAETIHHEGTVWRFLGDHTVRVEPEPILPGGMQPDSERDLAPGQAQDPDPPPF